MRRPARQRTIALRGACAAVLLALPAAGCGGGTGGSGSSTAATAGTAPQPATTVATPPAETLRQSPTADLEGVAAADAALIEGYLGWTPLPEPPIAALRSLGGAHAGAKRIFASPRRAALVAGNAQRFPYPRGTVIAKEGRSDGEVTLIAIMQKVRANDAATGGWRFVEYNRSNAGEPFARVSFPESGCARCHMNANSRQTTDWVFYSLR